MTLSQLMSVLRRRWLLALSVLCGTVATTVVVSLLLPSQYTAVASLVVDVRPDPIAGALPGVISPGYVTTQVDVIQSERVARRVVRNLRLTEDPALREDWQKDTEGRMPMEQWLTEGFTKRLEVRPSRESNVVLVAYRANDAKQAAALANGFVQAYLDTSVELRVDPARQFSSFFDQRSREARQALEEAQTRLSAFQREKGIIASDERIDVESARLAELSTQVVALQTLRSESASRLREANRRGGDEMPEVLGNSLVAGLRVDLARQQSRLKELDARLDEAHPQRKELEANIQELKARIQSETDRVMAGMAATDSINQQREHAIQAALQAQRQRVLAMKAVRDEGSVLMRDVENAQRSYDAVIGRLQLTSLESQTTQGQANWLSQALPPTEPSSPKILLNTALSVFMGMVLALACVLGVEALA